MSLKSVLIASLALTLFFGAMSADRYRLNHAAPQVECGKEV